MIRQGLRVCYSITLSCLSFDNSNCYQLLNWILLLYLQRKHNLLEGERHWSLGTKIPWVLPLDTKGSRFVSFFSRVSIKHPSLHSCWGNIWRWITYGWFSIKVPYSNEQGRAAHIWFVVWYLVTFLSWQFDTCHVLQCRINLPQLRSYGLLANMLLKWQL